MTTMEKIAELATQFLVHQCDWFIDDAQVDIAECSDCKFTTTTDRNYCPYCGNKLTIRLSSGYEDMIKALTYATEKVLGDVKELRNAK